MELSEKPRERTAAHERCPYCHDLLEEQNLELIQCPGCSTQHHQACIRELGRCSIYGCEHPLEVAPANPDLPEVKDSPVVRMVRKRIRDRVRTFVRDNATAPEDALARLREAIQRARAEERDGNWKDAKESWAEVARLYPRVGAKDLSMEDGLITESAALSRFHTIDRRLQERQGRKLVLLIFAGFALLVVVVVIVMVPLLAK